MKITILSHNLSSNAVMRAHRLAVAAQSFAEVTLVGPVESTGLWPALPPADWICTAPLKRFPSFHRSIIQLVEACDGDVLIACKPQLASFGVALVAAERRPVPVLLDHDDLDTAFQPRSEWDSKPAMADLKRPGSGVYVSLLTKATVAADGVIASSSSLAQKFGGVVVPHGCLTELFDPSAIDRERARRELGFDGPTVLFAGTPRWHKGLKPLAKAVSHVPGAKLAVLSRPEDISASVAGKYPLLRLPMVPYPEMPRLLAAADMVAIPQLDTEVARFQMPIKVYDAMAMGTPIVASAISDLPTLLEGCGRLVKPGDAAELAAAIRDLLENPAEARALGQRARQRCLDEFSMCHVADKLQAAITSAREAFTQKQGR